MLSKSPESKNNCVQPVQYLAAARDAFSVILENIDFSEDKKLLLPAYIGITDREGSGVFDPVQQQGVPYQFYKLDVSLGALKEELYGLIRSEEYRALLVIHYFGFCQNDMEEIVRLCCKHNVLLIEDCAHTMLSDINSGQLGTLGDFSFFSVHKYLATEEGGCLRINNKDYEHLLQKAAPSRPQPETLYMLVRADLGDIRKKRRSNYKKLIQLIRDIDGVDAMYPDLPKGISPHNLPIIVANGKRETVYFKLIDHDIPVIALYYRMIQPILEKQYENSLYVSENILNLPVHQDIQEDDLEAIARSLKESL